MTRYRLAAAAAAATPGRAGGRERDRGITGIQGGAGDAVGDEFGIELKRRSDHDGVWLGSVVYLRPI